MMREYDRNDAFEREDLYSSSDSYAFDESRYEDDGESRVIARMPDLGAPAVETPRRRRLHRRRQRPARRASSKRLVWSAGGFGLLLVAIVAYGVFSGGDDKNTGITSTDEGAARNEAVEKWAGGPSLDEYEIDAEMDFSEWQSPEDMMADTPVFDGAEEAGAGDLVWPEISATETPSAETPTVEADQAAEEVAGANPWDSWDAAAQAGTADEWNSPAPQGGDPILSQEYADYGSGGFEQVPAWPEQPSGPYTNNFSPAEPAGVEGGFAEGPGAQAYPPADVYGGEGSRGGAYAGAPSDAYPRQYPTTDSPDWDAAWDASMGQGGVAQSPMSRPNYSQNYRTDDPLMAQRPAEYGGPANNAYPPAGGTRPMAAPVYDNPYGGGAPESGAWSPEPYSRDGVMQGQGAGPEYQAPASWGAASSSPANFVGEIRPATSGYGTGSYGTASRGMDNSGGSRRY